jgi:hypothetical protein
MHLIFRGMDVLAIVYSTKNCGILNRLNSSISKRKGYSDSRDFNSKMDDDEILCYYFTERYNNSSKAETNVALAQHEVEAGNRDLF